MLSRLSSTNKMLGGEAFLDCAEHERFHILAALLRLPSQFGFDLARQVELQVS